MNWERILPGDCRDILPTLEAESVQCCVTSPPYWGLRDFGTAQWEGGDAGCDHRVDGINNLDYALGTTTAVAKAMGVAQGGCASWTSRRQNAAPGDCPKCGARRIDSQLGLEPTVEEYLAHMVATFREVWRVLKPDGTCWINMGDCYAGGHTTYNGKDAKWQHGEPFRQEAGRVIGGPGLKPKDLCMMPARLAMALQADGWYLRSEIVWHKPNPMPESVTDRPTKAHEMIYLLAKQERYFYDNEAIREPQVDPDRGNNVNEQYGGHRANGYEREDLIIRWKPNNDNKRQYNEAGRNKRSVWTVATQPFSDAHFATFPEDLIKPCILAGSKLGDTVLDPFAGSGTTGKVALELGRKAILIELNPDYIELARERTFVTPGFL